jgi:catechol 2,3-dioxygenase-like lactoylglutathione lyase family enzyme
MLAVGSIVIRVSNLEQQVRFWTAALHYDVRPDRSDDFALLHPRDGVGPNVSLDAVPSPRSLPPRIHLDLYADDQGAEVSRLIELGGREVPWHKRPFDADYIIMEDPEGNRFCVVDAAEWSGWAARGASHNSP